MSVMDYLNTVSQDAKVREWKRISIDNIIPNEDNIYPINELDNLVDSISAIGLEQNLVVKETPTPDEYVLITGHRRFAAIKRILDNNIECKEKILNEIKNPMCCVIAKYESDAQNTSNDKLIAHYRLHETNINVRRMTDQERMIVCEDYLNTVNELRNKNILINGKKIKGTSRELVAERFGYSNSQAQKLISITKGDVETKKKIMLGETTINKAYENKTLEADPQHKKNSYFRDVRKAKNLIQKGYEEENNAIIDNMTDEDFKELCKIGEEINHYITQIKIRYTANHS